MTLDRLSDLKRFSEHHGKFRYCSCMRWRLSSAEFSKSSKEDRINSLNKLVVKGVPVGLLAYLDGTPIGWCSIGPRQSLTALLRSRTLPLSEDDPEKVWSVTCFFVDAKYRGTGITTGLLNAAVEYARSMSAAKVEGFPVEPGSTSYTYMGSPAKFERANFSDKTPSDSRRLHYQIDLEEPSRGK